MRGIFSTELALIVLHLCIGYDLACQFCNRRMNKKLRTDCKSSRIYDWHTLKRHQFSTRAKLILRYAAVMYEKIGESARAPICYNLFPQPRSVLISCLMKVTEYQLSQGRV